MEITGEGLILPNIDNDVSDLPLLSYSQLQVWDRCEYAWHINYERKLVKKSTSNSGTLGIRIHSLLETFFSYIQNNSGPMTWQLAAEMVDEELAAMTNRAIRDNEAMEILAEIARAGKLVQKFLRTTAQQWFNGVTIIDVEKHFEVPLETPGGFKFILQGYVDLITGINGKIHTEDHKSTSDAKFWHPVEIEMDPQQTLYAYALRQLGVPVFGVVYNFLNTYEYKKKEPTNEQLFKRMSSYRTDIELENFAKELLTEVDRLIQAQNDPNYRFRRSLRRDCKNCQYQQPCLYALKGIDPEPLYVANYVTKERSK